MWADFVRSQAEAVPACDLFETVTLSVARLQVLAVTGHDSRGIRILGATAHPTEASWAARAARNLVTDLADADCFPAVVRQARAGRLQVPDAERGGRPGQLACVRISLISRYQASGALPGFRDAAGWLLPLLILRV
ncbi:MAG: hypothetical protein ACRDPY_07185 [Streptosporangiaceae bacterium]